MMIRKATSADLSGICAVADSVRLDTKHIQESGFLVYVLDKQGYADRLDESDLFLVAIDQDEVVGFILCYEDHTVANLVRRGVLSSDLLRARELAGCNGRWLYGDQIAVRPAYVRRGIGPALVLALYNEIKHRGIDSVFVGILHEPLNTASKAFCEGLGFAFRGTLRYEDGRLWGIYCREVPQERDKS
jgi:ribosomal protein S18 acetylase RimI-like enzyme